MSIETREYELRELTQGLFDRACETLGLPPEKVRREPQWALEQSAPTTEQMYRFCDLLLVDFDLSHQDWRDLEFQEGWAFFSGCFSAFLSELGSITNVLNAVSNASTKRLASPNGRRGAAQR